MTRKEAWDSFEKMLRDNFNDTPEILKERVMMWESIEDWFNYFCDVRGYKIEE